MVNWNLSAQEAQLILGALQASDPMKLYTTGLIERLVKEANEQLKPKEEPQNLPTPD